MTERQILDRQDYVDNAIYSLISELGETEMLRWDIKVISEIRGIIVDYLVERGLTEEEFYPYIEETA